LTTKEKLEAEIEKETLRVQSLCKHMHVAHWDGSYSSDHVTYPIRTCLDCGLVEIGGWGCYSRDTTCWHDREDYNKSILGYHPDRVITVEER